MKARRPIRILIPTLLASLLLATQAQAQLQTWTFTGEMTAEGVFSTFDVGDPFTLTITFDPNQTGLPFGSFTQYVGDATFTSAANATDTEATIRIADSPNSVSITLEDAGATLPLLEFTNIPGQFGQVDWIGIGLALGGVGSENLLDYLNLSLPLDPSDRTLQVVVPGAFSPIGVVDSVQTTTAEAVPTAPLTWLLLPALMVAAIWLSRSPVSPLDCD